MIKINYEKLKLILAVSFGFLSIFALSLLWCFSVVTMSVEHKSGALLGLDNNKDVVNQNNFNKDGYNEEKFKLFKRTSVGPMVTSTFFMDYHYSEGKILSYIGCYYDSKSKEWISIDPLTGKKKKVLSEKNMPVSAVTDRQDYDGLFRIFYTVFEDDKLVLKALDVNNKKIIWSKEIGPKPKGDLAANMWVNLLFDTDSYTVLVHQKRIFSKTREERWAESGAPSFGCVCEEGENVCVEECSKAMSGADSYFDNSEQGKEYAEEYAAGSNGVLALKGEDGKVKWEYSTDDKYFDAKIFITNQVDVKNQLAIYPTDADYRSVDRIIFLDIETGVAKKTFYCDKSYDFDSCAQIKSFGFLNNGGRVNDSILYVWEGGAVDYRGSFVQLRFYNLNLGNTLNKDNLITENTYYFDDIVGNHGYHQAYGDSEFLGYQNGNIVGYVGASLETITPNKVYPTTALKNLNITDPARLSLVLQERLAGYPILRGQSAFEGPLYIDVSKYLFLCQVYDNSSKTYFYSFYRDSEMYVFSSHDR